MKYDTLRLQFSQNGVFFADFWCILILHRLFNSLCVSNVYFFLHEFITASKILPVLVCFRHRTTTSISVLLHWYHRRSIATGLAFSTHLYNGPAFSSPAFSTRVNWSRVVQSRVFHPPPSCKTVSCFPVPRFQSSPQCRLCMFHALCLANVIFVVAY